MQQNWSVIVQALIVKDIDIWKFKSEEPNLEHLKFHVQFIFY